MSRFARWTVFLGILATALGVAPWAIAGGPRSEEAHELWDHYIRMVGCRDELEVLSCYREDLRSQLSSDNTTAGRMRLDVHMADMFEILQRDYDHTIVDETASGNKVTFTLKFRHRKKHTEYVTKVGFAEENGRWWITSPPEAPSLLKAGKGTGMMIAGIAIAIGLIAFLAKKLLA